MGYFSKDMLRFFKMEELIKITPDKEKAKSILQLIKEREDFVYKGFNLKRGENMLFRWNTGIQL